MPADRTPIGRTDVIFRQLDDEWVIFDPRTEEIHVLNLTASLVWAHCTGDFTMEQIVNEVQDAFAGNVESDRVLKDVEAAIDQFTNAGLLQ